ncbi:ABC transporter ATP-binding protein [Desulfoluna spongiiphila]|uniref:ABC transporter ATP-binding protein n=1 Tax=Desulfoluna spongiiphila TaxID=419481 RepID=UPI001257602E|nr:ABC transporter ATP-binding protein [Desulfoluna spongiiphila]VVS94548.1 abc transporter type 1 transmembrane domain [Desulfoluna spongiiphila]
MKHGTSSRFTRLFEIAGQKKRLLTLSAIFAAASSLLALVPYLFIYLIMERLLSTSLGIRDYEALRVLSCAALGGVILRYLLFFASTMFSHVAAFNILYGLRAAVVNHLGTLHMGYFTESRSGGIKKILSEDVEEIEQFIAHHIPDLVSGVSLPVVTIAYLFTVDWRMALIALLPLPVALFFQYIALGTSDRDQLMQQYHDAHEAMNGTIVEYVRGMPVVKVFNQTVDSFSRLKQFVYAYRDFVNQWTERVAPPWALFTVITASSLFFILPFGVWFYLAGSLSLPKLLLFLMLGSGYMIPLLKVAMMGGNLARILEGVSRIDAILSQPGISESSATRMPSGCTIEFDDVGFGYGHSKVLHHTSFRMEEGSVTALVGPSGAGKSTIAQLLLRMWDVDSGQIRIGGVDIRKIPHRTLMDHVGFVFQDVFIFSDTVYENIRMGKEEASHDEVMKAAEAAQCLDFIRALPDGIHTVIGEGGAVHLSGGERQRISLARILLKDAPIVVLDEATAYADAENEAKIQTAFARIMKDKTVIVIAHRLSTITDADTILVIDKGQVAESGSHERLIQTPGLYRSMWKAHTEARDWTFALTGDTPC